MDKRKKITRVITWFLLGFVALFLFRIIYGYTDKNMRGYEENEYISDFFDDMESIKHNYASDRSARWIKSEKVMAMKSEPAEIVAEAAPALKQGTEQKFEKIAAIKSKSDQFEQDEKKVREQVKHFHALIQYEHNEGNPGSREIHLSIGVPPENFDSMLLQVKKLGRLKSTQVTKIDKTNEYQQLNAKKISLEKIRATLIELKNKEGKIDEFISLSNRILEIEQELQDLGVSLGDFDTENEFCTIRFTISEGKFIATSFMHRLKVALEWTINYYCLFTLILLFASGASFFIVWIYYKIKPQQ